MTKFGSYFRVTAKITSIKTIKSSNFFHVNYNNTELANLPSVL